MWSTETLGELQKLKSRETPAPELRDRTLAGAFAQDLWGQKGLFWVWETFEFTNITSFSSLWTQEDVTPVSPEGSMLSAVSFLLSLKQIV